MSVFQGLLFDREIHVDRRLFGATLVKRERLPVSCNAATAEQLVEYLRKYQAFALARIRNAPAA